ncbi:glycosyltransferase [Candidatus Babela massiliensis]|uniref:Glycosyltransferase n=1 Tax=Candidatus Babela massiliensis TaxID=673862 RepID=V6DJQ7_9BACT|nr:glycosyltransferase [Candidatus Babela massiliensis]CDK30746.1 Glycosyltransferase [Candidatus Babela massiliensis]
MSIKFLIKFLSIFFFTFLSNTVSISSKNKFDVTVLGVINFNSGWGQIPIRFIDKYNPKLKINFIPFCKSNFDYVNDKTKNIINGKDKIFGNTTILFFQPLKAISKKLPKSTIKICYTMTESYKINPDWVYTLNKYFDAVVVPAPFLVKAHQQAGVKIPIFVLPILMDLDNYLLSPIKTQKNTPFTFGISAGFGNNHNKNQKMLIKGFIRKFKDNQNVRLKIRGAGGDKEEIEAIKNLIARKNATNISLEVKPLSPQENFDFMKSLDCYVLVSKGEGFSLTPREALALGIPCILSNNTAHEVICQTDYIKSVKDLTIDNVALAVEEVYNNYEQYLLKAQQAREWVKQYTYQNLEQKYINLIKPYKIILGTENLITDKYLMTNSKHLYNKYITIKN